MPKKLYRSVSKKMVAGTCAGVGDYFNIDETVVRLIFAILTVVTGVFPGLFIYMLAWIIIPEEGDHDRYTDMID